MLGGLLFFWDGLFSGGMSVWRVGKVMFMWYQYFLTCESSGPESFKSCKMSNKRNIGTVCSIYDRSPVSCWANSTKSSKILRWYANPTATRGLAHQAHHIVHLRNLCQKYHDIDIDFRRLPWLILRKTKSSGNPLGMSLFSRRIDCPKYF